MKKEHSIYTQLGLRALQRAAEKVAKDARKNNYKIPVWNNGVIEYKVPGKIESQSPLTTEGTENTDGT